MVAPLVSHRDFASLHPTGDHVERPERVAVLLDAFAEFEEPRRATQQELALCHDADYISKIQAVSESGRTVMLDADTVCTPSTYETARLAAGGSGLTPFGQLSLSDFDALPIDTASSISSVLSAEVVLNGTCSNCRRATSAPPSPSARNGRIRTRRACAPACSRRARCPATA